MASILSVLWGRLFDVWKYRKSYLLFATVMTISGVLLPFLSNVNGNFFIFFFITLSIAERGVVTIVGPGLVQLFGINIGSHLFNVKTSSFFVALILVPIL